MAIWVEKARKRSVFQGLKNKTWDFWVMYKTELKGEPETFTIVGNFFDFRQPQGPNGLPIYILWNLWALGVVCVV